MLREYFVVVGLCMAFAGLVVWLDAGDFVSMTAMALAGCAYRRAQR